MARYEHLPIYKAAMDLTVYVEQAVRNFSRYYKYTLGSDLRQQSRELVTVIIRANSRADKLPVLHDLRERLEGLLESGNENGVNLLCFNFNRVEWEGRSCTQNDF